MFRLVQYCRLALLATALVLTGAANAAPSPVVDAQPVRPVTSVTREEIEKLPTTRNFEDLIRACPSRTIPTGTTQPQMLVDGVPTSPPPSLTCIRPDDLRMVEVYNLHNEARAQYGAYPLRWNPVLAQGAQSYANQLAQTGQLVHASREARGIERENLSQGMIGWNTDQMMRNWLNEKRNFIPGLFPNVSRTGDWYSVGHYSQMIWPTTTDLGCGMATGSGYQWLVCRYSPGGNKPGEAVGANSWVRPRLIGGDYGGAKQQPEPTACRWIDTKTGQPINSGPIVGGTPDLQARGRLIIAAPSISDPNRAYDPVTGRNFAWDRNTCTWLDTKSGKRVSSAPIVGGTPEPQANGRMIGAYPTVGDPNRAFDPETGRNFAKVPVTPPK